MGVRGRSRRETAQRLSAEADRPSPSQCSLSIDHAKVKRLARMVVSPTPNRSGYSPWRRPRRVTRGRHSPRGTAVVLPIAPDEAYRRSQSQDVIGDDLRLWTLNKEDQMTRLFGRVRPVGWPASFMPMAASGPQR